MERSFESGQALIELLIGIFLVLAIFIFTHFAGLTAMEESRGYHFPTEGGRP